MTDKDDELDLGDELSLELGDDAPEPTSLDADDGLSLGDEDEGMELSIEDGPEVSETSLGASDNSALDLGGDEVALELGDDTPVTFSEDLSLGGESESGLDLSADAGDTGLDLSNDMPEASSDDGGLDLGSDEDVSADL